MAFNTFPTSSPWPPLDLANDLNDNFSKTVEVSLSTNPVDGAVLVYDASADIWTDGQETVTLDDLTNVVLDTAPTDGDVLTYDASSDTWINSPAVTYSLGELDDVVLPTTPTDGDALIYDASSDTWITGSGGVTTLEGLTDVVLSTNPNDGSALVYDASSDTWVDGEAAGGDPTINSQTGTSYTLVIGDAYNTVSMDNGSANTLTIPTNASVAFDTGTVIAVLQEGAGTTTISGDTGVTVNGTSGGSEDIGTQYASAALVKVGTDEWVVAVGSGSGGGGSSTLTGLSDTAISTTPNDGDVLTYDASSDTWVDAAQSGASVQVDTYSVSDVDTNGELIIDISNCNFVELVISSLASSASEAPSLRFSTDGGSTVESGSVYIQNFTTDSFAVSESKTLIGIGEGGSTSNGISTIVGHNKSNPTRVLSHVGNTGTNNSAVISGICDTTDIYDSIVIYGASGDINTVDITVYRY